MEVFVAPLRGAMAIRGRGWVVKTCLRRLNSGSPRRRTLTAEVLF